jgi:hypothetical protein
MVVFEPIIPTSETPKTVHDLDRSDTVYSIFKLFSSNFIHHIILTETNRFKQQNVSTTEGISAYTIFSYGQVNLIT